jgi:hypothetical protein
MICHAVEICTTVGSSSALDVNVESIRVEKYLKLLMSAKKCIFGPFNLY